MAMRKTMCADRGSASVWVVGIAPAFVAVLALVADGGQAITTRQHVIAVAREASRAGVDAADPGPGRFVTANDMLAMEAAAAEWVRDNAPGANDVEITVSEAGEVVTTVTQQVRPSVLGAMGVSDFTIRASSSARPVFGDDEAWEMLP